MSEGSAHGEHGVSGAGRGKQRQGACGRDECAVLYCDPHKLSVGCAWCECRGGAGGKPDLDVTSGPRIGLGGIPNDVGEGGASAIIVIYHHVSPSTESVSHAIRRERLNLIEGERCIYIDVGGGGGEVIVLGV